MTLFLLIALAAAPAPSVTLDPADLHFAAEVRPGGATRITPPQVVFLERHAGDPPVWTATVDRAWLRLGALRGTAPTTLVIDVPIAGIPRAGVKDEAHVTFSFGAGAAAVARTLRVTLDVLSEGHPPIGAFDQPADGTTVRGGGVRLSGWALDDIGLAEVEICRDPLPRTPPGAACGGRLTHLGSATFHDAVRPDVASAFPSAPRRDRSGWTFVLDTAALPRAARGTFRVYAAAKDVEGRSTLLGSKTVTVEPEDEGSSFGRLAAVLGPLALFAAAVHGSLLLWRSRAPRGAAPEEPPQRAVTPLEAVAIAAIVAVAVSIQLPAMRAGLGYDELYTWRHFVEGASFWKAASTVGVFNNHIAYSLLAGASVRLFGMSEWALRLPALLLGAGAVYCLWRFVREFAGPAAALLSALLLALSPMHVAWSRSARGYTGLALMTIVSSHRFFTLLRQPSRRAAIEHALVTTGATYFHLYGVWAGLAQYVLFAALAIKSRLSPASFRLLWRSFAAVLVTTVLLYSPVVLDLIAVGQARGQTAVQSGFPLALFNAIAGADSAWVRAIAAVLVVAGFVRLRRRARLAAYFVLVLAVPFCAEWLVLRPIDLYPRFFEFWTPVFCALVGVAVFARVGRRNAVFVIPAVVMALALLVNWVGQDLQPVPASGYREALRGRGDSVAGSRTFVVLPKRVERSGPSVSLRYNDGNHPMKNLVKRLAAAGVVLLVFANGPSLRAQSVPPIDRKITYLLPQWFGFLGATDAEVARQVAILRSRIGEGMRVKVGFTTYIFVSMTPVDPADTAAVRTALATPIAQMDQAVALASKAGIPICISFLSAQRSNEDDNQTAEQAADRRTVQWYGDNAMAKGWMSLSRYSRKDAVLREAFIRELGRQLAKRMLQYPENLVAASGDGEVELSSDGVVNGPGGEDRVASRLADYSPFAVAEFRDWLRQGGLYAPGQPFAGEGWTSSSRYAGDAAPGVDSNGDGHTLNGDFGITFTTWSLKHFDWSLSDPVAPDPWAIPVATYSAPGFNALPSANAAGFDAPRVRNPNDAYWKLWDLSDISARHVRQSGLDGRRHAIRLARHHVLQRQYRIRPDRGRRRLLPHPRRGRAGHRRARRALGHLRMERLGARDGRRDAVRPGTGARREIPAVGPGAVCLGRRGQLGGPRFAVRDRAQGLRDAAQQRTAHAEQIHPVRPDARRRHVAHAAAGRAGIGRAR